jgi:hypothetical protein
MPRFAQLSCWCDVETARADGRRIVLVTHGTVTTDPADLIAASLQALEHEDILVVVAGADATSLGAVPANARVARFIPFDVLVPLTDVYVTNGRFGGVMTAIPRGPDRLFGHHRGQDRGGCAHSRRRCRHQSEAPTSVTGQSDKSRSRTASRLASSKARARNTWELGHHHAVPSAVRLVEQLARTGEPAVRQEPPSPSMR